MWLQRGQGAPGWRVLSPLRDKTNEKQTEFSEKIWRGYIIKRKNPQSVNLKRSIEIIGMVLLNHQGGDGAEGAVG